MEIALFEIEEWEKETFRCLEGEHHVRYSAEPLNAVNACECTDCEVISTFIYSNVQRSTLEKLKNLRFIATRLISHDQFDRMKKGAVLINTARGSG